jgi:D-cysteine desulfhydrase
VDRALPVVAGEAAAAGRRPYPIPRGGATALGAVGYFLAAAEPAGQFWHTGGMLDVVAAAQDVAR